MQKNKKIKKKYKDLPEEQKQKRRDYQKQYTENMKILYRKKVSYKRVIYFFSNYKKV